MKPVRLTLTLASLAVLAMLAISACGGSSLAGDACATESDCGGGLTCMGDNLFPDGGVAEPGKPHICEHACQTDADCSGTKDHFGDTPTCGHDGHGDQFCVMDVSF